MAGSRPNFFKIIGSIDPDNDPHKTITTNEKATVSPIKNQCSSIELMKLDRITT